jgi:hypothetical protein
MNTKSIIAILIIAVIICIFIWASTPQQESQKKIIIRSPPDMNSNVFKDSDGSIFKSSSSSTGKSWNRDKYDWDITQSYLAFDGNQGTSFETPKRRTGDAVMYSATGIYTGKNSTNGYPGEWLQIELPYNMKVSYIELKCYDNDDSVSPNAFKLFGSNTTEWNEILDRSNEPAWGNGETKRFDVNSKDSYKSYRLVVNKNNTTNGSSAQVHEAFNISDFRLFGVKT